MDICLVPLFASFVTRRCPLRAIPRLQVRVTVHLINVFKAQCAGLIKEEPSDESSNEVHPGKNVTEGVGDSVVGERRKETDQDCMMLVLGVLVYRHELTISKPIARSCKRCLLGTRAKREKFADDNPSKWAPAHSKRGNEQTS